MTVNALTIADAVTPDIIKAFVTNLGLEITDEQAAELLAEYKEHEARATAPHDPLPLVMPVTEDDDITPTAYDYQRESDARKRSSNFEGDGFEYAYVVFTPRGIAFSDNIEWLFNSDGIKMNMDTQVQTLNTLGAYGWRVVHVSESHGAERVVLERQFA